MNRVVHQGRVVQVRVEDVTLPTGLTVQMDVVRHPGAAAILPLDGDDVLLIRQYRHCAAGWLWEIPAGTLNPGEDPETCARRELVEEAGVSCGELVRAGFIYTAPGFCDERIHIFIARELTAAPSHHDVDEVITDVVKRPYDEAVAMVARGEIVDAKSIAALLHGQRFRR
jgi:ADP-ribose pyrophosphatase